MTLTPARSGKHYAVIIGAGLMGHWHATYLDRVPISIAAVCDPDFEAAQRLAARHGNAAVFSALLPCLDKIAGITAVHVCAPASHHESIVALALERGLHVLCEKPLAANAVATETLLQLAARHGRILCPVHQYAFQDGVRQLIAQLPRLGELLHLELRFVSAGAEGLSHDEMNRVLTDILPHPLSLAQQILGTELPLQDWMVLRSIPGELHALAEVRGCSLDIRISMSGRPARASLSLMGSRGTVHADLLHGFSFWEKGVVSRGNKIRRPFVFSLQTFASAAGNLSARAWRREPAYPGLATLICSFYAAIRGTEQAPISASAIIRGALVRDRLIAEAGMI